jgi:hypothetical protein
MQSSHIPWTSKGRGNFKRVDFGIIIAETRGGMCYRHNLDRSKVGHGARWAWRIIIMGLRIGPCVDDLGPEGPCN